MKQEGDVGRFCGVGVEIRLMELEQEKREQTEIGGWKHEWKEIVR